MGLSNFASSETDPRRVVLPVPPAKVKQGSGRRCVPSGEATREFWVVYQVSVITDLTVGSSAAFQADMPPSTLVTWVKPSRSRMELAMEAR